MRTDTSFQTDKNKRLSFSNKSLHFILLITSLVCAALMYGDANNCARKIIDNSFLLIARKPLSYVIANDDNGVPFLVEPTIGRQRNPVTVCNSAMSYLAKMKNGDLSQKRYFINCADWIVNNRVFRNDSTSVLEYKYDWAVYKMKSPWQSGMAQGLSLQVLINAHEVTKDEKYLKAADEQLNSFFLSVEENGVTYKSPNEGWWYEEFADKDGTESRVLNGMMFATLGIFDYSKYTTSEKATFLYNQGAKAIKLSLPKYDKNGFSYYDRIGTPSSLKYHRIHVDLLQKMFAHSGEPTFKVFSEKWGAYRDPNFIVRLFKGQGKTIYTITFITNIIIVFLSLELVFILSLAINTALNKKNKSSSSI